MTNWYYIDGPKRVGPFTQEEWDDLTRSGKIGPATLVWHENLAKWTPYGEVLKETPPPLPKETKEEDLVAQADPVWTSRSCPEAEEEAPPSLEAAVPPFEEVPVHPYNVAASLLKHDYQIPVGRTLKCGLAVLSQYPWLLMSSTVLAYALVYMALAPVRMAMFFALGGVLMGGLSSVYLRALRRERPIPFDLFSGFRRGYFRNLAMKTFIAALVAMAGMIPMAIAAAVLDVPLMEGSLEGVDFETVLVFLLVASAGLLPAAYKQFCWIFAVALIRDKRLPYSVAMRLSRDKVLQHPWKLGWVLGLAVVLASLPAFLILTFGGAWVPQTEEGAVQLLGLASLTGIVGLPFYNGVLYTIYELIFNPQPAPAEPEKAEIAPVHHG